jgi:hypothetical protein
MISHCLTDGFRTFLDPKYYVPTPMDARPDGPRNNRVNHAFYRAKFGVKFIFNHHDVHLPKDYAYMQRCVARFKVSLANEAPHVYVVHQPASAQALFDLQALSAAFQALGCRHRILATLVEPTQPGLPLPQAQTLHEDEGLLVRRFTPTSTWGPLSFGSLIDEFNLACLLRSSVPALPASI